MTQKQQQAFEARVQKAFAAKEKLQETMLELFQQKFLGKRVSYLHGSHRRYAVCESVGSFSDPCQLRLRLPTGNTKWLYFGPNTYDELRVLD